jgi:hypothetical protein
MSNLTASLRMSMENWVDYLVETYDLSEHEACRMLEDQLRFNQFIADSMIQVIEYRINESNSRK